jgi:hypothetical protein
VATRNGTKEKFGFTKESHKNPLKKRDGMIITSHTPFLTFPVA